MTKQSGLGGALWVDEFVLSNDIQSWNTSGGPAALDVTGIDKSGHERLGGLRDGAINATAFFNKAAGQEHLALSPLPTGDTIVSLAKGTTIGDAACSTIAKQVNYDGSRGGDGALTFDLQALSAQQGVVWGKMGTAGTITDTAVGSEASIDNAAATATGLRAFIHVSAFTGTDATVVIQESSDDGGGDAFATIASFTSITGVGAEAIAVTGAIERYLRVAITVDNFTTMDYSVIISRANDPA